MHERRKLRTNIPVLIAGGGLVGLSAAMFLAQHGVSSLAIERLRGASQLPRAAFFHMRTIELFRCRRHRRRGARAIGPRNSRRKAPSC